MIARAFGIPNLNAIFRITRQSRDLIRKQLETHAALIAALYDEQRRHSRTPEKVVAVPAVSSRLT